MRKTKYSAAIIVLILLSLGFSSCYVGVYDHGPRRGYYNRGPHHHHYPHHHHGHRR